MLTGSGMCLTSKVTKPALTLEIPSSFRSIGQLAEQPLRSRQNQARAPYRLVLPETRNDWRPVAIFVDLNKKPENRNHLN